jgi:hypothetical protein
MINHIVDASKMVNPVDGSIPIDGSSYRPYWKRHPWQRRALALNLSPTYPRIVGLGTDMGQAG